MKLFNWMRARTQRTAANLSESAWRTLFSFTRETMAGERVGPDNAMELSAVYACIRTLADSIASLPRKVYRRLPDGSKEEFTDHPLSAVLRRPNPAQNGFEFIELLVAHLCLRGNFYALRDYDGERLVGLIPMRPDRMQVLCSKGFELFYEYAWDNGNKTLFSADQIWHLKGLGTTGVVGVSPIELARESLGLSMGLRRHGARYFANATRPSGVLMYPRVLSEEAAERLRRGFQDNSSGNNAWSVALLEEGVKFESVKFSNEDAQFLEAQRFQISDIARIFGVPGVLIEHGEKTATYASAEQFFLSYVVHTIRPRTVRIEQSINSQLLSSDEQGKVFVEFLLDGLLRGDTLSRYQSYAIGRANKWLSANDIRARENMNPIPGGDTYENPNIATGGDDEQRP